MYSIANKTIIESYTEQIWHQGNLEAADEYFSPDFISYNPLKPKINGLAELKQFFAATRSQFPDIRFTLDDMVAEDDKVVVRWTCWGTHLGPSPEFGIGPTGHKVNFAGITVYQIRNGKIVAQWEIWDRLRLLHQLGVVPVTQVYAV